MISPEFLLLWESRPSGRELGRTGDRSRLTNEVGGIEGQPDSCGKCFVPECFAADPIHFKPGETPASAR